MNPDKHAAAKIKLPLGVLQFEKYVLVGLANLVFTILVYLIFLKVLLVQYLVAFTVSWISGVLFTYIVNFVWVFKPEKELVFRQRLIKYAIVYLSSYLINFFSLKFLKEKTEMDPLFLQMFLLPLVVLINFSGLKFWSLKRNE